MVPIAIAGIILAFVLVDLIVQSVQSRTGRRVHGFFMPDPVMEESSVPPNYGRMVDVLRNFGIAPPHNIFHHQGHTWAAIEKSGEAAVGLDAFAQRAIGKIDRVELPQVGQKVCQGERLLAIRQGNRTAEFAAPIDGIVSSVRELPSRITNLGADWICKISPSNLSINLKGLHIAEDAVKWTYEELFRLQELILAQMPRLQTVGVTMQDGALALDHLLETLDDEAWNLFKESFLER